MSDVTAIGLGVMGSALARALLKKGLRVSVWNRTAAKAQPFAELGAVVETNLADAVRASPVILVCIDNYAVTRRILDMPDVLASLAGRILVQLSTGTPREARETQAWLKAHGVGYIDGAFLGGPHMVGTAQALTLVAGTKTVVDRCELLLKGFGGSLRYLGENIAAPNALDLAWLCQRLGLFLGLAHGVSVCEAERVDVGLYASMFPEGDRSRIFAEVVRDDAYENPPASLSIWCAAFRRILDHAQEGGISPEIPDFAAGLFERATAAGYGKEDVAALIKVLRK